MAEKTASQPLYTRTLRRNRTSRAIELIILLLLVLLIRYRIQYLKENGLPWLVALVCESWFAFIWILTISTKWNQVQYTTYPDRYLQCATEFPAVDIFVTTADPVLEPSILTVNTVLSLLAVDYPVNKLACYVSDDAASPITFYALIEAAKFAKIWLPFCKKYNVGVRAPFRYFASEHASRENSSPEFHEEWKTMKKEYALLCKKIEGATKFSEFGHLTEELEVFLNIDRRDHPAIIKIIWENKENLENGLPHLIYISREKRTKHAHHFKAGAMNVLTRVSGAMTNAPFMLNVDCDMYVNNPKVVLHAMCLLLGVKDERDCAFVQFPQCFYDGLKDDPYGNQFVVLYEFLGRGIAGIQGPVYGGTGCFHRRKVIYGSSPGDKLTDDKLCDEVMEETYGKSEVFVKSASRILIGGSYVENLETPGTLSTLLEPAFQVASSDYEHATMWGTKVGWIYGSATEDILTGLTIQGRGWKSTYCTPDPPAFLGCAPSGGPATLTQQKRWSTGLLEILFGVKSPFVYMIHGKLQFRQGLAYLWIMIWGLRSAFEICYAILPPYCIFTNSYYLPKMMDPYMAIPVCLLALYHLYTLSEYTRIGLSSRAWWNNLTMWRVNSTTAWLFGLLSVGLKILGVSETVFEVTRKDQADETNGGDANIGRYTFDDSPMFVPVTTIVLLNFGALVMGFARMFAQGCGLGEMICSAWVVLCFWPFLRGLFGKGKYGIPLPTIVKSVGLALLFIQLCKV